TGVIRSEASLMPPVPRHADHSAAEAGAGETSVMLLDRLIERVQIDHVLASAKGGMSAVLVLRGDAGAGKTALLDYAVDSAGDLDVVRLVGIESEAELGYAALHQLLVRYLGRLDSLPAPQCQALATARPLLCVVDDVEWLDQESADVLAFVARRLHADAVGMLFAAREPSGRRVSLDGLPSLHVPGLPPAEARQLLTHAAGEKASSGVIEQIITQISGNPLALIELGRDLAPEQLSGEAFLPSPLPVGRRLQARFLGQVRRLPAATQTLLLTAAADPTGDLALLWRAGQHLGFDARAAGPAEAAELVTIGSALAFRHPLVRS